MRLSTKQINSIGHKIILDTSHCIVRLKITNDYKDLSLDELCYNIYLVDSAYNIIWQVSDKSSKLPFPDDAFVYLGKDKTGSVIADRSSGFQYKIDLETGEATCMGFHK